LTLRGRKDSKHIGANEQVRVKAGDRMTVVKMSATRPAQPLLDEAATAAQVEGEKKA